MTVRSSSELASLIRLASPSVESPLAIATVQTTAPVNVSFDGNVDSSGAAVILPIAILYLDSYFPTVGDRVLMAKSGRTWVIIGSINSDNSPGASLIRASQTGGGTIVAGAWVEVAGFNLVDIGGVADDGQLSLSGGKVLVPDQGIYEFTFSCSWPNSGAGGYIRTLMGTGLTGLGAGGPIDGSRNDRVVGALTTGAIQSSIPWPTHYNKGDLVSGYLWQGSSASVVVPAGGLLIAGKRVG